MSPFHGILDPSPPETHGAASATPACFHDLRLDDIVAGATSGRDEYGLAPHFCRKLDNPAAIAYRQEVVRDLQAEPIGGACRTFASQLRQVRIQLANASQGDWPRSQQRWRLDAINLYGQAVHDLLAALTRSRPASAGLSLWRDWLTDYTATSAFLTRQADARRLLTQLEAIRFGIVIHGDTVTVGDRGPGADFSAVVAATFARFRPAAVEDHRSRLAPVSGMNHVEARILEGVARLHPAVFAALENFCARHADFIDPMVRTFDCEVQFYLAWLDYIAPCQSRGLSFCLPEIATTDQAVHGRRGFDLALAQRLITSGGAIVTNDFSLHGAERILVVTGPNQGGKTTFARMIGQLHWLAALGLPVPGESARLFLCDAIYTHFERAELAADLHGKLEDDLLRIKAILDRATPRSLVILNEIFSSTSSLDALQLASRVMARLSSLGLIGVCVTFLDELARLNDQTVSLVAAVDPADATRRTFRVERRPPAGTAYADSLARQYQLTYAQLRARPTP